MKVLGVVCSPRKEGNTEILVSEALASAKDLGADVELITLAGKNIAPCDGCEACISTRKCKINDDMQAIYSKLLEADGIIFGTPVYFWSVTAQAKALIDRTYVLGNAGTLRNKVAGVAVVARRAGATQTVSVFQSFFSLHRMTSVGVAIAYTSHEEKSQEDRGEKALAYDDERGRVRQDKQGMAQARALGRAIAKTIKALQKA